MPEHKNYIPSQLQEQAELAESSLGVICLQALTTGAISGLIIGIFRIIYTHINTWLTVLYVPHQATLLGILLTFAGMLVFGTIAYLCLRREPLIAGSGIPHVELVVLGKLPMPWHRILWTKFLGTLASLSGYLSVGREGPCIQMGAAVGCGVGSFWHDNTLRPRYLVGGSTAGMTAAFGAPIAGMLFAFEEMHTRITVPMFLFTSICALGAWVMVDGVLGLGLVFELSHATLALSLLWLAPVVGIICGMLSAVYNIILIRFTLFLDRSGIKQPWRLGIVFATAAILIHVYPDTISGMGPGITDIATGKFALTALLILCVVKILFNVFSFASGVSGGLLMPMLLAGGFIGSLLHACGAYAGLSADCCAAIVIFGMAGLFSGTVRSPLCGAFLITEMTGAWILLPACLVCAFASSITANLLHSVPVYDSLRNRQLHSYRLSHRLGPDDDSVSAAPVLFNGSPFVKR